MYSIKEIYYTLQGEGYHTGKAAIFLRFSGCNLWSGLEKDRDSAICKFCDTQFWGTDGLNGGKYEAEDLANKCLSLWPANITERPMIVCTGGEPLLQMDPAIIDALHDLGFYICIESNGTISVPKNIDWVCISPKADAHLLVTKGNELKVVYPQSGIDLEQYEMMDFQYFSLQPLDDAHQSDNIQTCITLCQKRPKWRLSLQTHKFIGIP